METQAVHLAVVRSNGRLRKLSRSKVQALADSITEIGLINPITVCEAGNEFTLVAGRHRLEAARLLGWQTMPATVMDLSDADRHLAEIDENLIRNELSNLERGEHLAKRKVWYEAKHPETAHITKRGGPGRGKKTTAKSAVVSYTADTAVKTGSSERTIRENVQIAESIPEDVRDAIRDTPIAQSKTDLLALSKLPEDDQRAVVAEADLASKASFREAIAARRPVPETKRDEDDRPIVPTTEIQQTVEAFALAALTLFETDECRRLIELIEQGLQA